MSAGCACIIPQSIEYGPTELELLADLDLDRSGRTSRDLLSLGVCNPFSDTIESPKVDLEPTA
jgi:hypothetical protein